ncbi:PREDICTED: uncharacterized protein LOC108377894 [Rhagoletis zephyria]|uniref:uncharacterized protein LOC108377894 n=1 Tax=Rhagoletis zephyria TaxID=28612 RepID=UPI0008119E8A|nr:PREDICTED: uncharacterized protein LOC108377894 [Rhagoletis zephyria]
MSSTVLNSNTFPTSSHHNRLPQLKLPQFDGKYSDYKRFIRTFQNMVDDDVSIAVVDKFNYLLNCLSGPALAVVEPFEVSDANYPKALARLKERYDSNVLIFLDYISTLFNLPKMTKPEPHQLRSIIDTVSAVRASLLPLGSATEIMNSMLTHVALSKVDSISKETYE